jgi:molybdopterin adenylyltransferase
VKVRPYHRLVERHGAVRRPAAVLTVSDGVAQGTRDDESGRAVAEALEAAGYEVGQREVVPDERADIERAVGSLARAAALVVTTGGTGFGPRDVTPEATLSVIDRQAPGLAEAMRAAGRAGTPMADLSRGVAGILGSTLVLNLPGSPGGAVESLEAVLPVLPHALDLLGGKAVHGPDDGSGPDVAHELSRRLRGGEAVVLATAVRVHGSPPCRPGQKLMLGAGGPVAGTLGCAEFDGGAAADAPAVLAAGEPSLNTYEHELGTAEVYLEPYRRASTLLVLGATPVALWLLRWGRDLGYRTLLVEPRTERVTPDHKEAADLVAVSPEGVEGEVDAVHTDHEAPMLAEHVAAVIRSGARFVGVMGSRRHAGPHLDRIGDLGLSERQVQAIRTPVGLDIGSRTPQEIALSILAGLVAASTGSPGGWLDR